MRKRVYQERSTLYVSAEAQHSLALASVTMFIFLDLVFYELRYLTVPIRCELDFHLSLAQLIFSTALEGEVKFIVFGSHSSSATLEIRLEI